MPSGRSEEKKIRTLERKAKKTTDPGADKVSAELVSVHAVMQGYTEMATVDAKQQIVVDTQTFGNGHETAHVAEIIESVEASFEAIDPGTKIFDSVVLTAETLRSSAALPHREYTTPLVRSHPPLRKAGEVSLPCLPWAILWPKTRSL